MGRRPYNRKDRFYVKAKEEGYASRSAYKIIELNDKFKIFKPGFIVVDLGSAPGGWFQVGLEKLGKNGKMIGIDLLPLNPNIKKTPLFKQADFTHKDSQKWIKEQCPTGAHWVISDMSPNLSGVKFADALASVSLCDQALDFALNTLRPGGGFLCKVFPGAELKDLQDKIKANFKKLQTVTPQATRGSSIEIYLIGLSLLNPK